MSGGSDNKPVPQQTKEKTKTVGKTASTTTPTLPDWLSGGLQDQYGQYTEGTDQLGQMLEEWRAAGFSPDQLAGFESQRGAVGPGGGVQAGLDEMLKTAQGDYLYGGEGFNAAVDAAYRAGMPRVLSQFGGAGRDDGGLAKTALAQAFADPFAAQYGQERGRQLSAAQLLPGMSLLPGQTLQDIGKQYQELEQYGINTPLSLYPGYLETLKGGLGFAQPFMGSATSGTSNQTGKTSGTQTPAYFPGNQTAGLLGGIATGASAGSAFGPWGALAGGIGGGALSQFG